VVRGGARWSRWCEVVRGGARWCEVVRGGARWCEVVRGGARLCEVMKACAWGPYRLVNSRALYCVELNVCVALRRN
jgi:hypothetical protein